ncbi:MAG: hypothetical protein RLZZ414_182 [Bacteroidota bacterium]
MLFPAIITLIIIGVAIILFATELISIDLVSLLIIVLLVVFGVNTPQESIDGFSNKATITTAFMFILSATVLKTGALQYMAHRVSHIFKYNFHIGMALMMVLIAIMSAFINNTPIVAIFIPVLIQIAHSSGQSPTKMLIPLSFASIFGGGCTLIGTSTNILISGIVEKYGFAEIQIFDFVVIGSIFALAGIAYMSFIGIRLLPDRKTEKNNELNLRAYVTEIELLKDASSVGKPIMESALVKELEMDIMEITRGESSFNLPSGDFILQAGDILKVRCDVEKMKVLKNRIKIKETPAVKVGGDDFASTHSTLIEIVITADTDIEGKTLKEIDFRRKYRATPIALKNRPDLVSNLYNVPLKNGDVLLVEVKNHFVEELKKMESKQSLPFVVLSENPILEFDKPKSLLVFGVLISIIVLSSLDIMDIMIASIAGVSILVLAKIISMKEAYEAISWKIIFLLVGSLSLGKAMQNSGLDQFLANGILGYLGEWGYVAVLSGLYLVTSLLTEIMSNHAAAALLTPIAIASATSLGINPTPFVMAIMLSASASFMTPIGYHANTMVYVAGNYKFMDFVKVGTGLNILFWILATLLIPVFFPF